MRITLEVTDSIILSRGGSEGNAKLVALAIQERPRGAYTYLNLAVEGDSPGAMLEAVAAYVKQNEA